MNNDNYPLGNFNHSRMFISSFSSFRIYQLDRDDASEYSATVIHGGVPVGPNSISSSKMSIAGQNLVDLIRMI
jgi:hypothetical protein